MSTTTKYTVLAYAPEEHDSERMWNGSDIFEAQCQLERMMRRWPNVPVRLTVDTYYDPAPPKTADAHAGVVS